MTNLHPTPNLDQHNPDSVDIVGQEAMAERQPAREEQNTDVERERELAERQPSEREGRTLPISDDPTLQAKTENVVQLRQRQSAGENTATEIADGFWALFGINIQKAASLYKNAKEHLLTAWERFPGQYLKGDEYAWEKVMTQLLSKRVEEIKSNKALTSADRIRLFNYYIRVKNEFQSQAHLLCLAASGDLTEEHIEIYLKRFGKYKKNIPVYESLKDGGKFKTDAMGNIVTTSGYIGTVRDQWFEDLVRKVSHIEGKVPGMWHSGPRAYLRGKDDKVIGVGFRSPEERAGAADIDLIDFTGQRADIAMDMYLNHLTIRDADKAKATEALLRRKHDTDIDQKIFMYGVEERKLRDELIQKEGTDEARELQQKIKDVEEKIEQENKLKTVIEHRLARGYAKGDVKSLLLDPTSDASIEVDGKTFYEKDLAMVLGIRKYYQARSENDIARLVRGYSVKLAERLALEALMGEKTREEFSFACKHHMLGVRTNGRYDKGRDASENVAKFLTLTEKRPSDRLESENFSEKALNYKIVRTNGQNQIVALDDDGIPHLLDRSFVNPDNPEEFLNFNIHEPWNITRNESGKLVDPHYQRIVESEIYRAAQEGTTTIYAEVNEFTNSLMRGMDKVNDYLRRRDMVSSVDLIDMLHKSQAELNGLRSKIMEKFPPPHWQENGQTCEFSEQDLERIKTEIVSILPASGAPLHEIKPEETENIIVQLGLNNLQAEAVRDAVWKFNEGMIREIASAQKRIPEVEAIVKDASDIIRDESGKIPGESSKHLITRLGARRAWIEKFIKDIPLDQVDDASAELSHEQRERLRQLNLLLPDAKKIDIEAGSTLWDIVQNLEQQEMALGHALFVLGANAQRKQPRRQRIEYEDEEEELGLAA